MAKRSKSGVKNAGKQNQLLIILAIAVVGLAFVAKLISDKRVSDANRANLLGRQATLPRRRLPRKPIKTPRPTRIPKPGSTPISATPTPTPTPSPGNQLPVLINAAFYSNVSDLLKPGDIVAARAPRQSKDMPLSTTPQRFTNAVNSLNALGNLSGKGIRKSIVFSSKDDVAHFINQVPADINIISYNSEGGMTPDAERFTNGGDMAGAVAAFAQTVHNSGREMTFGPLNNDWNLLANYGKLDEVMSVIDAAGIQGQGALEVSEAAFISLVQGLNSKFDANGGTMVKSNVQLWVGRNSASQIISAFNAARDIIDLAVIFSDSDPNNDTRTVILGLNR